MPRPEEPPSAEITPESTYFGRRELLKRAGLFVATSAAWGTLGLLAFFTALAHFLVYAVLDQSLGITRIARDVVKHPFVAVGFTALVLLVPLAVTSTKRSLTRMGFARWKRLHRLVYAVGVLAVVHFVMRVKADVREPYLWGTVVALLFAVRVVDRARQPSGLRRRAIHG